MKITEKFFNLTFLSFVMIQGCALMDANVNPVYQPEPAQKSPLSTLKPTHVVLEIEDQRPAEERYALGHRKNGFGAVTASVKSSKEAPAIVYDALRNELINNGHSIDAAKDAHTDLSILVALKRFWSEIRIHFWDLEVLGALDADVTIRDSRNNSIVLSKQLNGASRESRQIGGEGAYESVLNAALAEFVRGFARDPVILKAFRTVQDGPKMETISPTTQWTAPP